MEFLTVLVLNLFLIFSIKIFFCKKKFKFISINKFISIKFIFDVTFHSKG